MDIRRLCGSSEVNSVSRKILIRCDCRVGEFMGRITPRHNAINLFLPTKCFKNSNLVCQVNSFVVQVSRFGAALAEVALISEGGNQLAAIGISI